MNKETLEYIVGLGQPTAEMFLKDGLLYEKSQRGIKLMLPQSPSALLISTISGVVDYIMSDTDKLPEDADWIIQVESHKTVNLITQLSEGYKSRETYLVSKADVPGFETGKFMDVEDFIINLQSRMLDAGDKAKLIAFCSTIEDVEEQKTKDNGISQTITAKVGISTVAEVEVPNPVALAPFRTFCDIEQPISNFIFRVRKGPRGPECGLFEADGGAWRSDSIRLIAMSIRERLAEYTTRKVNIIA